MTRQTTFSNRLAAAASALFISLTLFIGTVSTPDTAYAHTTVTVSDQA